jgi:SAM-dependent methyltransferase
MLRCLSCGLVYAADRHVPPGLYEEAYTDEGEYGTHFRHARGILEGKAPIDWMATWIIDRVPPFGQKRYLDLGCGVGSSVYAAQQKGWIATGQDVSENALRAAREVFNVQTTPESVGAIAASGRQFELITALNLIEHLPDPLGYLKIVRKLVVDGGQIGLVVPNYDSYAMRHTTCAQWLPPFHLNFFTLRTLDAALRLAGFRLTKHHTRFASWSGVDGGTARKLLLAPYLVANALIGRLRGNAVIAIAQTA